MVLNAKREKNHIITFIQTTLKKQHFKNVVLGLSGGVDSATCLYLLKESIPLVNIFIAHLSYFPETVQNVKHILQKISFPQQNTLLLTLHPFVDRYRATLKISKNNHIRLGNIMARIRMTILFDLAKKHNALVCGSENKSEHFLGYFTRFGDAASDFEPLIHLYKTQVYQLASSLTVPKEIINLSPSANLWKGQTDEKELGFTYKEADEVLYYYIDKKLSLKDIEQKGYKNAHTIIMRIKKTAYKHHTPYSLL